MIINRLLWSIFEGLAVALCFAHQGRLPNTVQVQPPCVPVLHRDIKPTNIFLAGQDATAWRALPKTKLADWGVLIQLSNPDATLTYAGTSGWKAPECYENRETDYAEHMPGLPSADIWSVGRVMLALANLERPKVPDTRFGQPQPTFFAGVRTLIPLRMAQIIEHCLQELPSNRPSCHQLWTAIQTEVAVPVAGNDTSMRDAPYTGNETLLHQADKYLAWSLPPR